MNVKMKPPAGEGERLRRLKQMLNSDFSGKDLAAKIRYVPELTETQSRGWEERSMNDKKREVRTAAEGRLNIHVTISGLGEELNEAFCMTADSIREVKRRLRKRGIESVSYKIERSRGC